MPALWKSSQSPMYVRTVWVDGFRHVILSQDDPHYIKLCSKRRRPNSSTSFAKTTQRRNIQSSLSHHEVLGECLRKFSFIRNDRIEGNEQKPHIEKLNLSDVDSNEDFIIKSTPQPLCDIKNFELNLGTDMRAVKSNRTSRTEVKENTELSDRVLQWLDLAGKVSLLTQENVERVSQPRHSWPEIQRGNIVKSKTATDMRKEPKPTDNKTSAIDRQEAYIPTSANTIENYARQSRNRNTRHDTKIKENKKIKDMRASVVETRQKMVSERHAVEKQYAEMVSKKLIPDIEKTKKQVHIFIPEALANKGSTISSVPESLLSTKS